MINKELLSLILGKEVKANIGIDIFDNNILHYLLSDGYVYLNLDTLSSLIKEKLKDLGYVVMVYHHHDTVATTITSDNGLTKYSSPSMSVFTELESLIDAVNWAAKKKGLIC